MADLQSRNTLLCMACSNHTPGTNKLPRETSCSLGFRVSGQAFRIMPPVYGYDENGESKLINRGTTCEYYADGKGIRQHYGEYAQSHSVVGLPELHSQTIDSESLSRVDSEFMEYAESM